MATLDRARGEGEEAEAEWWREYRVWWEEEKERMRLEEWRKRKRGGGSGVGPRLETAGVEEGEEAVLLETRCLGPGGILEEAGGGGGEGGYGGSIF
jgi:hypothetical protein